MQTPDHRRVRCATIAWQKCRGERPRACETAVRSRVGDALPEALDGERRTEHMPQSDPASSDAQELAVQFGARIKEARAKLTGRWLERIVARVNVPAPQVFPTDDLLDHMPLLIEGIAAYLQDGTRAVPADAVVIHRARELGALRHAQAFSEYEILKEFEILGSILFSFLREQSDLLDPRPSPAETLECAKRLFQAVSLVQQATTAKFLELARAKVAERETRLRAFHRALTHEMRNRIGATLGAGQILQLNDLDAADRERLTNVIVRNADGLRLILDNLLELTRLDGDSRQQRHVTLRAALNESVRQVRDMAAASGVRIEIGVDIPEVEVNAAALELCVVNFVANSIKYSNPAEPDRWVRVTAELTAGEGSAPEAIVTVDDNGLGIPEGSMEHLFERFYRAHTELDPHIEGTGLGLSLVRETAEAIGGKAWAERVDTGGRFRVAVPARRTTDPAVLNTESATPQGA